MKEFKSLVGEVELVYKKKSNKKIKILQSSDTIEYLRSIWPSDISIRECFLVLFLNRCNNIISHYIVSMGGINGTVIDVRMIAKAGIDCLASGVILSHNHPSGNINPSNNDIELTKKISEGLKLLDMQVLDHIIISDDEYYSFIDNGNI